MSRRPYRQPGGSRYDRLPEQVVVDRAQSGDRYATEHLLYKYRALVRTKTRSYFLIGADRDDLVQVGMIGLWQSIMDYSPEQRISFLSFARICIERHVITAVKAATRRKQIPLNNAVSLDRHPEETDDAFNLTEVLVSETDIDPEELLLRKEDARRTVEALRPILSTFEWNVLKRYILGKSYREIAAELRCKTKSVDNALGRIKRKAVCAADRLAVGAR